MQSEIEFKNIKKVYGDKVVMEGFSHCHRFFRLRKNNGSENGEWADRT